MYRYRGKIYLLLRYSIVFFLFISVFSIAKAQEVTFEQALLKEINLMRQHPQYYAEHVIKTFARYYRGRYIYLPKRGRITSSEGVRALYECVRVLKATQPLKPLLYSTDLAAAACLHVADQSRSGRTGHRGSNGSFVADRVELFVEWENSVAENIFYGPMSARETLVFLMIDDGVRDRGHRKNFLSPNLKYAGISRGYHPIYTKMVVIDFAGGVKGNQ